MSISTDSSVYREKMNALNDYLDTQKKITNDLCTLERPCSSHSLKKAEESLGFPLPDSFVDFYTQTNGMQFHYWNRSRTLNVSSKILELEHVFGGWARRKNGLFGQCPNTDWTTDVFSGIMWFDHYETMMTRSAYKRIQEIKMLESVEGLSAWIAIHFEPKQKHQLYLVYQHELVSLQLSFEEYIRGTLEVGALTHWWAFFLPSDSEVRALFDLHKVNQQLNRYYPDCSFLTQANRVAFPKELRPL